MKRMIVVLMLTAGTLFSQNPAASIAIEGKNKIQNGFAAWNETMIREGSALCERAAMADPQNVWPLYWSAFAHYRLAIMKLYGSEPDEDAGKQYIETGLSLLEKINTLKPGHAESLALTGSLTGMKIRFNPLSAMWLGPKSQEYMSKAVEADPKSPRVFYLTGIGTMNTPSMFGGGADKATGDFLKAIRLYEEEATNPPADPLAPTWGYDECYSFLGSAYEAQKMFNEAKSCYQKSLTINPESRRAKAQWMRLENKNTQ